jgi:hypothetical protein
MLEDFTRSALSLSFEIKIIKKNATFFKKNVHNHDVNGDYNYRGYRKSAHLKISSRFSLTWILEIDSLDPVLRIPLFSYRSFKFKSFPSSQQHYRCDRALALTMPLRPLVLAKEQIKNQPTGILSDGALTG